MTAEDASQASSVVSQAWDTERFRSIIDNLREVVFQTDAQGLWTFLNPAWTEITGFPVEDSLGRLFLDFIHPEDRELNMERFRPLIERKKDHCRHEIRYLTRDGGYRWIEVHARLTLDAGDVIVGTSGTLTDVTARRQAVDQVQQTQRELETVLASSPAVLFVAALRGEIPSTIYVGKNSLELLGYPARDFVADPRLWAGCLHPEDAPGVMEAIRELTQKGYSSHSHRFRHADGRYLWVRTDARLTRAADGTLAEITGCMVDVTESHGAALALGRREAVLEAVSFAAQRFLNSSSWKDEVELVLERLALAAGVARITIRQASPLCGDALLQYQWNCGGEPAVVDIGCWRDALERGEPIAGPAESFAEPYRSALLSGGTKSVAILPVLVGQTLWGTLTFAESEKRNWNPVEIEAFKAAAGILGAAIGRDRADETLRSREATLSAVTSAGPLAFLVVDDRTDEVLYFNRRFCEIWGLEHLENRMLGGGLRNRDIIPECTQVLRIFAGFAPPSTPLPYEGNRGEMEDEIPFLDGRIIRRFSLQIRDAAGGYFGRLYIFEDITVRRRMEEALRLAHAELDERVRDRTADLERLNEALRTEIDERRSIELALARSEQHFRALIENTVDVILLLDDEGRIRYASPSLQGVLGRDPVDVEGRELTGFVQPRDRQAVLDVVQAARRGQGAQAPVALRFANGAGEWRLLRAIVNNQTANPAVRNLIVTLSDITEQQRAEDELRENEQRYRLLFQASSDGILLMSPDRRVLDCNSSACRMFGYPREQMVGICIDDLDGQRGSAVLGPWSEINLQMGVAPEGFGRTSSGRVFPIEIHGRSITVQGARIVIAFVHDMTQRKAAERTLRESEQRYRAFVEQSTEGIWRLDFSEPVSVALGEDEQVECMYASGYVAECNEAMARLYGFSCASEMLGTRMEDLLVRSDPANRGHLLRLIRSGYRLKDDESYEPDREGKIHCFLNNIVGLVENGCVQRLWGTLRDITEGKAAEAKIRAAQGALRDSEALYRSLVETSPDAILLLDPDHTMRVLNPQALALFGFRNAEEALGRNITDMVAQHERGRVSGMMSSKLDRRAGVANFELTLAKTNGAGFPAEMSSSRIVDAHGNCTGILAIVRDITERKQAEAARIQLEEQFRQAQKMEAVGRLAGGVAHDFNNLLTVITGYCELLLKRADPASPIRRNLTQIKKASDRAAALVQQLLAFSRKQMIQPKVLDVSANIADLEKMLRRLIGEDIDLSTRLDPAAGCIKADPGQIEQMIMNLTVNARDAMPQGGTIVIWTGAVEVPSGGTSDGEVPPGSYVLVSLRDTGVGMSEDVRSRIFEPFFTTKEVGRGTGLGLSTVYGIVKQGGGHITVISEPGKGTEFRIYLPAVAPEALAAEEEGESAAPALGAEVVLLVEDEEMVREMARETLEECGYRVIEARNGEQAVAAAQSHTGEIELLLTDVVMPRMGGPELAATLRPGRPDMKVCYMSGYADKDLGTLSPLLRKPFTPDDLARRVQDILKE